MHTRAARHTCSYEPHSGDLRIVPIYPGIYRRRNHYPANPVIMPDALLEMDLQGMGWLLPLQLISSKLFGHSEAMWNYDRLPSGCQLAHLPGVRKKSRATSGSM